MIRLAYSEVWMNIFRSCMGKKKSKYQILNGLTHHLLVLVFIRKAQVEKLTIIPDISGNFSNARHISPY